MHLRLAEKAAELGFIGIGFSVPHTPLFFDQFTAWISGRKNAGMSWLERNVHIRENPSILLPGCHTIISLAFPYSSQKPGTPDSLCVSRYSEPDKEDYHRSIKKLCKKLAGTIREVHKEAAVRISVDSAPILERSLAYASGIGFIGKNNMLIIPGFGSYFYLAEILTTAVFDIPAVEPAGNLCGSCSLCVDSCPAGALEKPYHLDASICLSYRTIEQRSPVGEEEGRKMGDCFFGCDRCQEACPHNGGEGERRICLPSSEEFLTMDRRAFTGMFGTTAFARAGLEKIQTNIRAIMGGDR